MRQKCSSNQTLMRYGIAWHHLEDKEGEWAVVDKCRAIIKSNQWESVS